MPYLLSPLEVTELFCLAMLKYGNREDEPFPPIKTPSKDHIDRMQKRCNENYSKKFSEKVFGNEHIMPRLLYDMKRIINKGAPFLFSNDQLEKLVRYIDLKSVSYKQYEEIKITDRQILFEDKVWLIYSYGERSKVSGIIVSPIKLFPFGRAVIKDFGQEYAGFCRMYDANHILFDLKLIEANTKDLRMLLYCGASLLPKIMVGQYHNFDDDNFIISGSVIFALADIEFDKMTPEFIPNTDDRYINIPEPIRKILENPHLNLITSPSRAIRLDKLAEDIDKLNL